MVEHLVGGPEEIAKVRLACGRTFLQVAGYVVSMQGDLCRDEAFPRNWDTTELSIVAHAINTDARLSVTKKRWWSFASSYGAGGAVIRAWWVKLLEAYEVGTFPTIRAYHTLSHVDEILDLLGCLDEAIVAAAWFHDFVNGVPGAETQSALVLGEALFSLRFPTIVFARAQTLVLATETHVGDFVPDKRRDLFLDADLWILGSPAERYDRYAADIRREYSHNSDEEYRGGRSAVLQAFLDRPKIYATPEFERFEQIARRNIQREIDSLGAPTTEG